MGVCNLTMSWFQWSKNKQGETFHARPGHEWGGRARTAWQQAHDKFRTGWLTGTNATNVFEDWTFFTFVREPRSRLTSGMFEVALRKFVEKVGSKKTKDATSTVKHSAPSLYKAVTASLPCQPRTRPSSASEPDVLQCVLDGEQGGISRRLSKTVPGKVNPHILPQSLFLLGARGGRTFIFPQLSHVGKVEHLVAELTTTLSVTMQVTTRPLRCACHPPVSPPP